MTESSNRLHADIAIIGAGAAGLMAAVMAGRAAPESRIVVLDGAVRLGAKILVAGGGRCNVTHHAVEAGDYAGSTQPAIRKVLQRFEVACTVDFFAQLGVQLKREETGKLFPVTNKARTVLDALLRAVAETGAELLHPWRVEQIHPSEGETERFVVVGPAGQLDARRVILATGGRSLPKTGSDGHGYTMVKSLGHNLTSRVFPALVPLTMTSEHWICGLSGVATPVAVEVRSGSGRRLKSFQNALLCTHFGLSGPAILDVSRFLIDTRADDPDAKLVVNWLPPLDFAAADRLLQEGREQVARVLSDRMPRRLAECICDFAGIETDTPVQNLARPKRRALAHALVEMELPIAGHRGYTHAEVTAGGVPLSQLQLGTMESRVCPGLYLCGEICDVDGRIGGFNFQWAWASGFVAGQAAAQSLLD